MTAGFIVSALLLLSHNFHPKQQRYQRTGAFGVLSFDKPTSRATLLDTELEGSLLDGSFPQVNNENHLERVSLSDSNSSQSESSENWQELDDRHDEIVKAIIQHFRGDGDNSNGASNGGVGGTSNGKSRSMPNLSRANVQLPPGWGKTQLSLQLTAELYKNGIGVDNLPLQTVIYVTPYLKLVDQTLDHADRFGTLRDIPHSQLIVASDTTRADTRTTCPEVIAAFLANQSSQGLRLVISTYASLPKVGEALALLGHGARIGLGIFDEAHAMEGVGIRSGHGLYDALLPTEYRLFLTATPQRYSKSPKAVGVLGTKVACDGSNLIIPDSTVLARMTGVRSFNDESLFGPCVLRRTFRESVEQNITVPLTLYAIDEDEISAVLGVDFDSNMSRESLLPFVLRAAKQKLNFTRAVSFHSRNKRAQEFAEQVQAAYGPEMLAVSVNGRMSADKREEMLSRAKNAPTASVVANCKVLATGVDEAEWDLVFMADPVRSPVQARQMIGRVSRVAPNKARGYVLVPALKGVNGVTDLSAVANDDSGGYAVFTSAFQAMCADDPKLQRDVIFVTTESERLGRPLDKSEYPLSLQEAFVLPSSMPVETKKYLMDRMIIDASRISSWDRIYDILLRYKSREGNCDVPYSHEEDGVKLGLWLSTQRQLQKAGVLDAERKQRLEDAGVVWNTYKKRNELALALLLKFKEREGHCNVPKNHVEDGVNIFRWLKYMREAKRRGKLETNLQRRLDEVGVVWNKYNEQWENNFQTLQQYQNREGHCDVPKNHEKNGVNIGKWLSSQRRARRLGKLNASRQQKLDKLGIVWDISQKQWNYMFSLLMKFKKREGHCNAPGRHKEDGMGLGNWVTKQRQLQKEGNLNKDFQQRLEEVGFVWDISKKKWDRAFDLLLKFKAREGHCNVPCKHKESGFNLGRWMINQRQAQKDGSLDAEHAKRLEQAGIVWDTSMEQWERMFEALQNYKDRYGNCDVPQKHIENGLIKLGPWLATQRRAKKSGKLDAERQEWLEKVGIVWDVHEQVWEESFSLLLRYMEREGNCNVPQQHEEDGFFLGMWLMNQRQRKKAGRLNKDAQERLEAAGVLWNPTDAGWEVMFRLLLKYKARHGDCEVPLHGKVDGKNLGHWLRSQRRAKKVGRLDGEKRLRLEKAKITWSVVNEKWEQMIALLTRFKEKYGHCYVPWSHQEDGLNLGQWLHSQRKNKKYGKMDQDRQRRLENIGVVWDVRKARWEQMFMLLLQYKEREGHCDVPQKHKEGNSNLGVWLHNQRTKKRIRKLDKEWQDRLEQIGVRWEIHETSVAPFNI